jgi:hypothetical protein
MNESLTPEEKTKAVELRINRINELNKINTEFTSTHEYLANTITKLTSLIESTK